MLDFDLAHLNVADIGVLLLPAGKSGHIELGYLAGRGKPTYIRCNEEPDRFDVLYRVATKVCFDDLSLFEALAP